MISKSYG